MKHSDSYGDQIGGPAGENLYWSSNKAIPTPSVDAWYSEIEFCGAFPGCKDGSSGTTGHFTPIVWAGVKYIACTRSNANTGLIACRYGGGPGTSMSCDTPNMGGCYKK